MRQLVITLNNSVLLQRLFLFVEESLMERFVTIMQLSSVTIDVNLKKIEITEYSFVKFASIAL